MYVEQLSGGVNPPRIDVARLPARSRRQIDSVCWFGRDAGCAGADFALVFNYAFRVVWAWRFAPAADGDVLEHVHFFRGWLRLSITGYG